MSFVLGHVGDALRMAFEMFWAVLWPLALGFLLSSVVETFVSKQAVSRLLGHGGVRPVALATLFGAASSSCSYAAVAVARTLFRKGATLPNAIIFEFASTNLVFELGLALLVLLGWQFLAAEFVGGLLMVVLLALLFRVTLTRRLTESAGIQAERGTAREDGGARRDGHVGHRGSPAAASRVTPSADVDQPLLLHERVRALVGPAARVSHRRRDRRMGARCVLVAPLLLGARGSARYSGAHSSDRSLRC